MGARGNADALVVLARPVRQGSLGRVGFTVSKKVGKAHERNLVKRRLRHLMRQRKDRFAAYDVVVIARASALAISFEELSRQLDKALGRALEECARRRRNPRASGARPRPEARSDGKR